MSVRLKITLLIVIGVLAHLVWGVASYNLGGAQWITFVGYSQYIAISVIFLIVPHAKSFMSADPPSPPPSQPTTTTESTQ